MNSVTFVLEGGDLRRYEEGGLGHVLPGPDGRTVYTRNGIVSRTLQRSEPDDASYGYCVPAVRGDYFLSISPASPGRNGEIRKENGGGFTVYLRGLKPPIARLDQAEHGLHFDQGGGDSYEIWRRVVFVPDAKLIILLPRSNDQLVLQRFDPEAALVKSGLDFLVVTSRSPTQATVGKVFTYKLAVIAKNPKVEFKLESGPKGMAVSASGEVTWPVPADAAEGATDVILSVRDATARDGNAQEVFHTFALRVVK